MAATTRSPRVLYHCPCHLGVLPQQDEHHHHHSGPSSSSTAAGSSSSSSSTNPLLPTQWAASRYSYHPLPLLYFCADCLAPRCHLCAQQEIITHYCPACLFEVPSASVKAERNRCPRNCFLCPTRGCGSYLSVVATDPDPKVVAGRLEAVEASVGRPPYFLTCARCKWDSKTGFAKQQGQHQGFVFEKPTGTSAQLDAQRGPFTGQQEMDRLRNHFETFMRKQHNSNANSGAGASGSLPTSSSKSKLLRDVPGLGDSSKYLSGSRRGAASAALGLGGQSGDAAGGGAAAKEELAPYRSEHAASSRQEAAQDLNLLSSLGTPSSTSSSYGAPLSHRFTSGWDSGPSSSPHPSLEPLRVPLETKKTLRCPSCRHILVKPDPKATSHRWKIKLAALNYLPEVTASFKGARGGAMRGGGASASVSATAMEAARRRLGGTITPSPPAPGTVPLAEDLERLQPGQSYEYEISFRNPLEDVISVRIAVVQPTAAAAAAAAAASAGKEEAGEREDGKVLRQRIRAHAPWIARPSTSRFTVKPFDDVDGVIDDDLLEDARGGGRGGADQDVQDDDEEQSDGFEDVLSDEEAGGAQEATTASRRSARSAISSLGKGIVRKKGNETVIALRLDVRDAGSTAMANLESADVEVALRVTFTFRGDEEEEEGGEQAAKESGKGEGADATAGQQKRRGTRSLAFWTVLRLGRLDVRRGGDEVDQLSARSSGGYLSVPSALRVVQPPADSVDSAPGTSARRRSTASTVPPSSSQLLRPDAGENKGESTAEQGEGGGTAAAGGEEEDKEARLARLRKRRSEMTLTGSSRGA